jgi:threonyl-tRNA synthetase
LNALTRLVLRLGEVYKMEQSLLQLRHSCENVLMAALKKLYPGILKYMESIEKDGFYVDVELPEGIKISEFDFPAIEQEMQAIIDQNLVQSDKINAFKLLSLSGAYWQGDRNNKMLTRLYGTAFGSPKELESFLLSCEEAKKRDHRKIGKELGLFTFAPDSVGQGLPLWLPKGTIIRDELESWARATEAEHGYQRVVTPIIGKAALYECSGHLAYFKEDMYAPITIEEEHYYLRPMNCPHHHQIYKSDKRSYRDLPYRIAEYGNTFRYESSGSLSGLMRVRGFCQNDAHIYCREDQVEEEFADVLRMYMYYYKILGIHDYYMRLSKPDLSQGGKYVNRPEEWEKTLQMVCNSMKKVDFPYVEVEGEAAFYGPKIDVQIKSAIGTEYTISTNQLDFIASERFDLDYVGQDGAQHPVYVIHRAPLGSHERMIAYLIEHFAGAFPVWLSPVQAAIVPVSDRQLDYCQKIYAQFLKAGIRLELDRTHETMSYKIRKAIAQKTPYIIIIGDEEVSSETVTIRDRKGAQKKNLQVAEFLKNMQDIIHRKSLELWN